MANPHALVDGILSLSPRAETLRAARAGPSSPRFVTVQFHGGRSGLLDMTSPRSVVWAEVLESLQQANAPAYVELDPATHVITQLLCPLTVGVGALTPTPAGDALEVELLISQARHYLRRTHPDFQHLQETLQAARAQGSQVVVTETPDTHEIIDVRPLPRHLAPKAPLSWERPPSAAPGLEVAPVTPSRAQALFTLVSGKTCCPATAASPCIPFQYPDDGCWGRAHEMCRLMIDAGAQPQKVWIYGNLRAATYNHPSCQVLWGWHVAPILLVSSGTSTEVRVIDPSLCSGPVPQNTWAGLQGDPSATLVQSSAAVFHRSYNGTVTYDDANYTMTQQVLNTYRLQLRLRAVGADGPPPYLNCMSRPPRVQWFGTLGPQETRRWYTYNWPAAWHVVWTVMPLTHCPGAPQLTWKVQVERAAPTLCSYWITVSNLTSGTVRFEGRYDILSQ